MRGAKLNKVRASLSQAELAVDGKTHIGGVIVFLPIVFPPADRAQLQCIGGFQRPISAARTTIASCDRIRLHVGWTGEHGGVITRAPEISPWPFASGCWLQAFRKLALRTERRFP